MSVVAYDQYASLKLADKRKETTTYRKAKEYLNRNMS